MYEVVAMVIFNGEKAPVIAKRAEYTFRKYPGLIIGQDAVGTFLKCYKYDRPTKYFKAFGGDEFDIHLEDGEVEHCYGQWWDGGSDQAADILGKDIIRAAYGVEKELENCYVFSSGYVVKEKFEELMASYTGKIYTSDEYKELMRERGLAKREAEEAK
ncbi:hypothetical protein ACTFR8_24540 [Bacillus cereus group sp. MYBK15-3]|uniref:hypothetical protein n=1 Tax=unclassified Bacillus cereus group TaxID=2750818 RepID=UPI003F7A38AF